MFEEVIFSMLGQLPTRYCQHCQLGQLPTRQLPIGQLLTANCTIANRTTTN